MTRDGFNALLAARLRTTPEALNRANAAQLYAAAEAARRAGNATFAAAHTRAARHAARLARPLYATLPTREVQS